MSQRAQYPPAPAGNESRDFVDHVTNRFAIRHCLLVEPGPLSATVFEIFGLRGSGTCSRTHEHTHTPIGADSMGAIAPTAKVVGAMPESRPHSNFVLAIFGLSEMSKFLHVGARFNSNASDKRCSDFSLKMHAYSAPPDLLVGFKG